jgi:hypothetical protein
MGFTVLVTGAATAAGRSLLRELSCDHVTVFSCDCDFPTPRGAGCDPEHHFAVHKSDDPEFVGDVVTLCLQHDIDVLVPMRASDLVAIERARQLFEGVGAKIWLAPIPAQATRSLARRILQLGQRTRALSAVKRWLGSYCA